MGELEGTPGPGEVARGDLLSAGEIALDVSTNSNAERFGHRRLAEKLEQALSGSD
jgi:hypothetical protein